MSFGETITKEDVADLLSAFSVSKVDLDTVASTSKSSLPDVRGALFVLLKADLMTDGCMDE